MTDINKSEHGAYAGVVDVARNGVDEVIRLTRQSHDLALLVRRLLRRLIAARNGSGTRAGDDQLSREAMDYLRRKGFWQQELERERLQSRLELDRLNSALREHMQLTRDAIEQCDKLRAQVAELERQPIRWRPIREAPRRCAKWVIVSNGWCMFARKVRGKWFDETCAEITPQPTHFAEIVGPEGESC